MHAVLYPALSTSEDYALWRRDFTGASGVFSAVLSGVSHDMLHDFVGSLEIFRLGASFGSHRSLIAPAVVSADRSQSWPADATLVRFSIGLEHPDDLRDDLESAFTHLHHKR